MHRRTLGRTTTSLPVIGMGSSNTFDVGTTADERAPLLEVLRALHEAGGTVMDTSPMYGTAEGVVGDVADKLGLGGELFLATKVWTTGRAEGIRQMEESFQRLRTKRIDLMQVHNLVDSLDLSLTPFLTFGFASERQGRTSTALDLQPLGLRTDFSLKGDGERLHLYDPAGAEADDVEPGPMLGDVLTFKRDGGGHVALYVGEDAGFYHVLGGNQSDQVCITRIARSRLHKARRPKYNAQPANVRKIALAASGKVSSNEA